MPIESMAGVWVCAGSLWVSVSIITTLPTPSAPQAKSTADYIQASKARIAQYEQQVRLDLPWGIFSAPHPGLPLLSGCALLLPADH